jgi:hypothetical protein
MSDGRFPGFKVNPDDIAFEVFLYSEAYDLMTVWNFHFFYRKR